MNPFDIGGRERWALLAAHLRFSAGTALEGLKHNRLRAALTSLGILFGVASVITMLAIGKGAEQEILQQMVLLGANNIMVTPLVQQSEGPAQDDEKEKQVKKFSPGLTYADAEAIARSIPLVDAVSAEIVFNSEVTREGRRRSAKAVGVDSTYFALTNLQLERGSWFTHDQLATGEPVAIIGDGIRTRFFTTEEAIGRPIKVGDIWLTVVGVLTDRRVTAEAETKLGVRDANMDVYIPARTMLLRFRDRARVTGQEIEAASREGVVVSGGNNDEDNETEEQRAERTNRNQLDRIIVRVADGSHMTGVTDVLRRMLERRHNGVVDFEIEVPELLLRQQQRAKTIFNVVLGAIASISLLVGGIGIMNIMLASVLERIREIGVRRALGATQRDVLMQFLSEAVMISVAGGVVGILLGMILSALIQHFAGIKTLVSFISIFVAFGVSFAVGVGFGIVPAYRAARQDPVECLRYE
ncbi:MAG TPA: ABC transporter permease [Gemmatimonadales bacterium]|nr:ABC transporter permease [Gemmatimonadales bacterium]